MATNSAASKIVKKSVKDFKFIKEIGTGSYSTVHLAIETATQRELALKAVSKELITRLKKIAEVFREKEILARLTDCSYAIQLDCTFQNEHTLYHDALLNVRLDFGLTYCPNGDLLQYISDAGHFDETVVRFYTAELIEALDQLHSRRIIHRDLKPENILLTDDMHIQLTDFGSSLILDDDDEKTDQSSVDGEKKGLKRMNSFVGTAQFVAPEILQRGPVHVGSDLWSLGCVIYQMATGKHLFRGHHEYDIFNAVVRVAFKIPDDFPELIGDLIRKLVCFEPNERLGSPETGGIEKLKAHELFSEYTSNGTWERLLQERSPLPANPKLSSRPGTNA